MTGGAALRRSLSLRDLIVYGLLFIGPLAPVGVFGVLDARTDGAVALVYLLATIAMAFTAWSYAEMSRVVPHAGSVFAYASEGLGPASRFPRRMAGDARLPAHPVGRVPLLGHRAARARAVGARVGVHPRRVRGSRRC